jgi:ABC-2 type transport system ATP-binding protein
MITVEGLTKRYGRTVAVDNISFSVEKGQIVGFLGPNGAGKTTTMRVLTCFLPPTSGTAHLAGFDVLEQPLEVKKRIGYLPETPPLYPEMEVAEYLRFVGRLKGVAASDIGRRLDEVCGLCAIGDVRNKLIGKLSKGYRQRVGLAQAIIHNPDVLILDEPTAGLDPKQIIETRELIKGLAGDHTIILSTHILPEVSQTCQRVAVDTPENLTSRLRGSETMYVQVDGGGEDAHTVLAGVGGVTKVTAADRHDAIAGYEVESVHGHDVRRELARTVITRGWGLLELRPVRMSLEDIFLSLTTEETAAAEGTAQDAAPADAASAEGHHE